MIDVALSLSKFDVGRGKEHNSFVYLKKKRENGNIIQREDRMFKTDLTNG